MDTSELLNLLLSSAVIVALIEWISKNKSNYLQHITNNRAEWRKSLKDISVKLYDSDKTTIGSVFTALKGNLNSYGLHPSGNYPSKIKLDYLKDEHLWAEMDEIQTNLSSMSSKEFLQKKERMVEMISLLLKFDWERSKREVRSKIIIPLGFVLYLCTFFFVSQNHFAIELVELNNLAITTVLLIPYCFFWVPLFFYSFSIFQTKHWYRNFDIPVLCWLTGFYLNFLFFSIFFKYLPDFNGVSLVFFLLSIAIPIFYTGNLCQVYCNYEQALLQFYPQKLVIFASSFNFKNRVLLLPILLYFRNYNIKIDDQKFTREFFQDSEFQLILSKLSSESIIKKDSDILKIRSRVWYYYKKKSNANLCVSDFIEKNPSRCRIIIKYCNQSDSFFTLCSPFRNKQYWKSWRN